MERSCFALKQGRSRDLKDSGWLVARSAMRSSSTMRRRGRCCTPRSAMRIRIAPGVITVNAPMSSARASAGDLVAVRRGTCARAILGISYQDHSKVVAEGVSGDDA